LAQYADAHRQNIGFGGYPRDPIRTNVDHEPPARLLDCARQSSAEQISKSLILDGANYLPPGLSEGR
jgi:hypothetical protein